VAERERAPVNDDTWLEFLGPRGVESCCGLCGNSGIVDTRGKVSSPVGEDCGVRTFCICPNGRVLKHHQDKAQGELA
jgi:hypothetical protein